MSAIRIRSFKALAAAFGRSPRQFHRLRDVGLIADQDIHEVLTTGSAASWQHRFEVATVDALLTRQIKRPGRLSMSEISQAMRRSA